MKMDYNSIFFLLSILVITCILSFCFSYYFPTIRYENFEQYLMDDVKVDMIKISDWVNNNINSFSLDERSIIFSDLSTILTNLVNIEHRKCTSGKCAVSKPEITLIQEFLNKLQKAINSISSVDPEAKKEFQVLMFNVMTNIQIIYARCNNMNC